MDRARLGNRFKPDLAQHRSSHDLPELVWVSSGQQLGYKTTNPTIPTYSLLRFPIISVFIYFSHLSNQFVCTLYPSKSNKQCMISKSKTNGYIRQGSH